MLVLVCAFAQSMPERARRLKIRDHNYQRSAKGEPASFRQVPANPIELSLVLQNWRVEGDQNVFGQIADAAELEFAVVLGGNGS